MYGPEISPFTSVFGLFGEESRDLFTWRTAMKIIILFTVLILIFPVSIFGSEADNIIKQQKESKRKNAEARDKRKRDLDAREQCLDKITEVVALKIKELIDKGVKFKKPKLYNDSFEYIDGKRYAVYYNGMKSLVRTSMYEDRFIALQVTSFDNLNIYFQPENGHEVRVTIYLYNSDKENEWELQTFVNSKTPKANRIIKFKSIYDIDEIERKRGIINNNIVKAIEAAIKYVDK
jgi:hypothetical protein